MRSSCVVTLEPYMKAGSLQTLDIVVTSSEKPALTPELTVPALCTHVAPHTYVHCHVTLCFVT